jgi:hypothetical protein
MAVGYREQRIVGRCRRSRNYADEQVNPSAKWTRLGFKLTHYPVEFLDDEGHRVRYLLHSASGGAKKPLRVRRTNVSRNILDLPLQGRAGGHNDAYH